MYDFYLQHGSQSFSKILKLIDILKKKGFKTDLTPTVKEHKKGAVISGEFSLLNSYFILTHRKVSL